MKIVGLPKSARVLNFENAGGLNFYLFSQEGVLEPVYHSSICSGCFEMTNILNQPSLRKNALEQIFPSLTR